MKKLIALLFVLSTLPLARGQDATELEAQYSTCEKHHIPADKCTPEIYRQLKEKDNAPLDPKTTTVLQAVKEYQASLKNRNSIQVHIAYLTDDGVVCLDVGGQNGTGGISVSRIAYITQEWNGAKRLRGHWLDESGIGGSASADLERMTGSGYNVNRWDHVCTRSRKLLPGTDVTEKVNQALRRDAAQN